MKELVAPSTVEQFFVAAALALPVLGLVLGVLVGLFVKRPAPYGARGLALGLLGPAVYAAWRLYNAVTDRLGLDSTTNLIAQVVLFVTLGGALALGREALARRLRRPN